MHTTDRTYRIVAISAGVSEPSSTRLLTDRLTQKSLQHLEQLGLVAEGGVIELAPIAGEIARATTTGYPGELLREKMRQVAQADAIIAVTPVYKAGPSGLFKSFFDILDDDVLIAKPVLLGATAGSGRHALVIDQQMRPLFAYLRALTLPTSVFAASEDWSSTELGSRIDRAAIELSQLVASDVAAQISGKTWDAHRHDDSRTTSEQLIEDDAFDYDSPLMRLAVGR
ncbi:CE1759 family FMN reductase [uncultured Microbacterium sp.]|uniref:CE1759 family FMN reductase n=1 Tax=uncultured Microbacterium sp. TaxID=191216 RepID=UPI0035CADD42